MNWALAWFDLPADASERDVKRAYARKVKETRPDTDPEGFQTLHVMYQHALAWCRNPVAEEVPEETPAFGEDTDLEGIDLSALHFDRVLESLQDATVPSVGLNAPDFDFEGFYSRLLANARLGTPETLRAWLAADESLWSLALKVQVGSHLLHTLGERQPPLRGMMFDVILDAFDLRELHRGIDPYALLRLRDRLDLQWTLHPANDGLADDKLKQLVRPFAWRQILPTILVPRWPTKVRDFLLQLDEGNLDLPPPVQPRQVAFWSRAADMVRWSWPRTLVGIWRCVAYSSAFLVWFAMSDDAQGSAWNEVVADAASWANLCGILLAYWAAWYVLSVGFIQIGRAIRGRLPAWAGVSWWWVFLALAIARAVYFFSRQP